MTEDGRTDPARVAAEYDPAAAREFFTCRAAGWDARFPDDGPAFRAAVAELGPARGAAVLDAGCGTGRALEPLRTAVGPEGTVLGFDLTPTMIAEASGKAPGDAVLLAVADAARLPLRDAALDAVFASGLLTHLPDPAAGLREFARVVRTGGRLALFHPVGRAALAARKGRDPSPDDIRAESNLRPLLAACGWTLGSLVDAENRYLAVSVRV